MRSPAYWVLSVALLAASWQVRLVAQDARGAIVGKVLDSSGAVVPNAPVQVTNKAMGTRLSLTTNEAGFYQASFLIPGVYQVTVELPGFKRTLRDNLQVRVNDRLEVNVTLEIGTAEQSITVSEETPLLSTNSASMGSVVSRVGDLPSAHGNPYPLIGLATGVAFARDPRQSQRRHH